MNRLDNKVALITGGARGQGAAEARLFVAAGARVIITDVLADDGNALAAQLGDSCEFMHHDVTSEQDWNSIVEAISGRHGQLDVLVNNAGIFRLGRVADTTPQMWDEVVAVNQTGVFLGMRAVTPIMKAAGAGSIVNISSIAGLGPAAVAYAYGATKWAVRGMSKSAALELGPYGVRVNSVHPGLIETDMLDQFGDQLRADLTKRVPLGRTASADEIARLVLFLASDDSSYCTGHEFVADGAMAC